MASRAEGPSIEPLWEAAASVAGPHRGGRLPAALAARFPGDLAIDLRANRPTVIANLVSSIDGVVALGPGERSTGGGEISGFSEPDRFMMALLRGLADAVIVGAGTVRVGSNHEWTARKLQPQLADVFAEWRAAMGIAPQPTTVVVSASGELDFGHRGLSEPDVPVIVATTQTGARRLADLHPAANVTVTVAGSGERVAARALLDVLRTSGVRVALCEGGPHLLGELLAANLVDELFLTAAPQLIGRPEGLGRLGLVEGADPLRDGGWWARLAGVRRAGDYLFLRYRFDR
jgi:riboflavin biosynthesis pyrimidine reductase